MSSSLLTSLLAFYEEDPSDPFNVYALAIEYAKSDAGQAEKFFEILLKEHPGYLPTYYHAAAFYAESGKIENAENCYKTGIALALAEKNAKAHRELSGAYTNFLDELDD